MTLAKLFVSYARVNKIAVDELTGHLGILGCQVWVDTTLQGGQDWWEVILGAIADCDGFLTVVSRGSLSSEACAREFEWAESLGKPVLPIAIEALPGALPARISKRHVIDYSGADHRAALALAGALAALPPAPPLPKPLPPPPPVPLSYLTELIDLARSHTELDPAAQYAVIDRLELALRSLDPVERQGARDILDVLLSRADLAAEARSRALQLAEAPTAQLTLHEEPSPDDEPVGAQLRAVDGELVVLPATGLRIGRLADNDLVLDNPKVSRHHALVVATPDGFVVRDLGSANGTYVGEAKVLESHLLHGGDRIKICDRSWTFELIESPEV